MQRISMAVLGIGLSIAVQAQALEIGLEERFCLMKEEQITNVHCRAEKFPGQFYYTAFCPDPDNAKSAEAEILLTSEWTVVKEGIDQCAPLMAAARETIFLPGRSRGGDDPRVADSETDQNVVRVLFGTNRKYKFANSRLKFTGNRERQLHLGALAVSVPADHDVGAIERPWSFTLPFTKLTIALPEDPDNHFSIRWLGMLTRGAFIEQMRDAVASSEDGQAKQAFVFIHGFNVEFDEAAFRTAQIAHDMKFDGAPILYSWPSRGDVEDYFYDQNSAAQTTRYLTQFLTLVKEQSGADVIHLIAHSMGNNPLLAVLRDFGRSHSGAPPLFNEVVLAAPDVDVDVFLELAEEIGGAAHGFTLYANKDDRALDVARAIAGGVPRAGDIPPAVVTGIDTIDITALVSGLFSLNHSGYADDPTLIRDLGLLFHEGLRPPDRRDRTVKRISHRNGTYWKFP